MSPRLLRWFTSHAPKNDGRKLAHRKLANGAYEYDEKELRAFDAHLWAPWPKNAKSQRPNVPEGIMTEIKREAAGGCAFCRHLQDCEGAHIEPVSTTDCNHPHGLLWTCPNHHTAYDHRHHVHATMDSAFVRVVKRELLESQARLWRAESSLENSITLLATAADQIRAQLAAASDTGTAAAIKRRAEALILQLKSAAERPNTGLTVGKTTLAKKVRESSGADVDRFLASVASARGEYLLDADEAECPLCRGAGGTPAYPTCPVCNGDGEVPRADVREIDLRQYQQVNCPLCEGGAPPSGYDRCPVCSGEGHVPRYALEEIDVREYQQVACTLCKGKGSAPGYDCCPVCQGDGNVPRYALEEINLREYQHVDCPLCSGRGSLRDHQVCPVCGGEGKVPRYALEGIDLRDYSPD